MVCAYVRDLRILCVNGGCDEKRCGNEVVGDGCVIENRGYTRDSCNIHRELWVCDANTEVARLREGCTLNARSSEVERVVVTQEEGCGDFALEECHGIRIEVSSEDGSFNR